MRDAFPLNQISPKLSHTLPVMLFPVSGVVQRQKEFLHRVTDTATDYGMHIFMEI